MFVENYVDGEVQLTPETHPLSGLIAWLETRKPDEVYYYNNASDCLVCRFFRASGINVFCVDPQKYSVRVNEPFKLFEDVKYPSELNTVARDSNGTYGDALALAKKLRGY